MKFDPKNPYRQVPGELNLEESEELESLIFKLVLRHTPETAARARELALKFLASLEHVES